jgi:hypothetical protein
VVHAVVIRKILVLDMAPFRMVQRYQQFSGACCLHLQDKPKLMTGLGLCGTGSGNLLGSLVYTTARLVVIQNIGIFKCKEI